MSSSFKAPFLLLDRLFSKAIAFQRLFSKTPVGSTLTLVLYYSLTIVCTVVRMRYEFTYKSQLARYVRMRPAFTYKSQLAQFDSHNSILIGLTRSPVSTIRLTRFNPDRINSVPSITGYDISNDCQLYRVVPWMTVYNFTYNTLVICSHLSIGEFVQDIFSPRLWQYFCE